ncbi:MAG: hypothetical protein HOH22_07950 [Rhodospirillaceae bacterium]|nr:hypothetical protein [Rhodospirillaceae bacterium]
MFINANQLTESRAPSDAGSVAFQVAIKQQKQFEVELKRSQERRESEIAAERARAESRRKEQQVQQTQKVSSVELSRDSGEAPEPEKAIESRGTAVDVEV